MTNQSPIDVKNFLSKNWFFIIIAIYVLVPLDLVPDSLPFIGNLDDTGLLVVEIIRRYADYKRSKKK